MHPFRARALVATLALLAAGCQDYNFNPVGHCLIQPGSQSFTLSSISTADVLFVVDDSGSMAGEQQRLADAFSSFVGNLSTSNTARLAAGLPPIDFHLAVTTTSVFWNFEANQTCSSSCGSASGNVCCISGATPALQPRKCPNGNECTVAGTSCRTTCNGYKGEGYCCAADNTFPQAAISDVIRCDRVGAPCGKLETHYNYGSACATGDTGLLRVAPIENGWPYPDGAFVGIASDTTSTANPRVIHYDKRLYTSADHRNAQGFDRTQLDGFFRQNVQVGICGSGEEQGLQGGRLAVEKAFAGQQKDTYTYDYVAGLTSTSTPGTTSSWDPVSRTAGNAARWPNPNSKLVLVFVGDEDDCASPPDPSGGVVMLPQQAGQDACVHDGDPNWSGWAPGEYAIVGNKQKPVGEFVDYFTSLGRPLGAAFIVSATSSTSNDSCSGGSCVADICCDYVCTGSTDVCALGVCGGQGPGSRLLDTAHQLQAKGVDTVIGSICDPNFGGLLNSIAEITKPPDTLTLPSVPAEGALAMLRIVQPNGDTRKICGQPLPPSQPTNYATVLEAQNTEFDWWFTPTKDPGPPSDNLAGNSTVAVPTKYVYVNTAKGHCQLAPGETWALDYLGIVPARTDPNDPNSGGCATAAECTAKLGGQPGAFKCFKVPDLDRGTCTCGGTTP